MAEDRNSLLGVLAVRKGYAQPADVLAASMAISINPSRTLTRELLESGALNPAHEAALEKAADEALGASGGDVDKAIAANGGIQQLSSGPSLDDEPTRTEVSGPPSFGDDEDEPTKVLDWDRAIRKSK